MNGTNVTSAGILGNAGVGWRVKGAEDINNNGTSEIILQNINGQAEAWQVNGTSLLSQNVISPNPGGAWQVAIDGTSSSMGAPRADFDGDGNGDFLWQNTSGQAAIWQISGAAVNTAAAVGSNPGSSWHVKGSGDFDGDGNADILWQNDSGQAAIWLMNGTNVVSAAIVGSNPGSTLACERRGGFRRRWPFRISCGRMIPARPRSG